MTWPAHGILPEGAGTPTPEPDVDDTIWLAPAPKKPPLLTSRRAWLAGAGILGTACLLRGVSSLVLSPRPPPVATASLPVPLAPTVAHPEARSLATPQALEIRAATEQEILRNVATGLDGVPVRPTTSGSWCWISPRCTSRA